MDKLMYQIQYTDNSYRMVDWTIDEFKQVGRDMERGDKISILNDGIFSLVDVRAIVLVPEIEQENTPEDENELTDWGFVDPQTAEWLKANGIDLGGKNK